MESKTIKDSYHFLPSLFLEVSGPENGLKLNLLKKIIFEQRA